MNRALIPRGLRHTHAPAGATRNYEIWNDRRGEEDEGDEADDAMKALEARTEVRHALQIASVPTCSRAYRLCRGAGGRPLARC